MVLGFVGKLVRELKVKRRGFWGCELRLLLRMHVEKMGGGVRAVLGALDHVPIVSCKYA